MLKRSGGLVSSDDRFVKHMFIKSDEIGFKLEDKSYTFDLIGTDVEKAKAIFGDDPKWLDMLEYFH